MSTAIQKPSRGVSTKRPSRSSVGAKATRVDEDVEPAAERAHDLGEDRVEVVVGAYVALGDERASRLAGELAHVFSMRSPW